MSDTYYEYREGQYPYGGWACLKFLYRKPNTKLLVSVSFGDTKLAAGYRAKKENREQAKELSDVQVSHVEQDGHRDRGAYDPLRDLCDWWSYFARTSQRQHGWTILPRTL